MIREWLGAMLSGDNPHREFPADTANETVSDEANIQGVIALLHEKTSIENMSAHIPADFREHIAGLARKKAQQSLMREAECRRILARLQQAGINALLLKGSALAYWLYPSAHLRDCSDIDLLFASREETAKAITLLQSMQYGLRDPVLAGDLVSFEQTCVRDSDTGEGLEIDLHWRLSSSPIFAYKFDFEELDSAAMPLPRLGTHARGLSPIHAFFNACMHRIQNMSDYTENNLKWLYDLHLLSAKFRQEDWGTIADIAAERKLAGVCVDAMLAARHEFNSAIPENILSKLASAARHESIKTGKMHRWFYIQRMSFMAFPTWGLRMRWLRQRLLPNTGYLRTRYGETNMLRLLKSRIKAGFHRLF